MEGKQRHLFEHLLERSSGAVPEWSLGGVSVLSRDKKGLPASNRVKTTASKNRQRPIVPLLHPHTDSSNAPQKIKRPGHVSHTQPGRFYLDQTLEAKV